MQEQLPRERVWADPDMGAILPIKGLVRGGIFSSLFVAVDKKGLAHLLVITYGAIKVLRCETNNMNTKKSRQPPYQHNPTGD